MAISESYLKSNWKSVEKLKQLLITNAHSLSDFGWVILQKRMSLNVYFLLFKKYVEAAGIAVKCIFAGFIYEKVLKIKPSFRLTLTLIWHRKCPYRKVCSLTEQKVDEFRRMSF